MRQLVPEYREFDPDDLYAGLTLATAEDRAYLAIGMVASLDGATTIDGVSGGLGGQADRIGFRRLRDAADTILVGASTVRDERYRPVRPDAARQRDRRRRGLAEAPRLVIVSGSLALDTRLPVFGPDDEQPVIVTGGDPPADAARRLDGHAELVPMGGDQVDLRVLLEHCFDRGWRRVLCEGGPRLNAQLLAHDVVDEMFLTIVPKAVAGGSRRVITGEAVEPPRRFAIEMIHEHEGELLLRYRRDR